MQQHARTRVAHDFLNFYLHVWLVAVDKAFAAGAFLLLKWAFVKTHESVGFEFGAFGAKFPMGFVVCLAVDVHHVVDGFLFSGYAWVFGSGLLCFHLKPPRGRRIWFQYQISVYPNMCGISALFQRRKLSRQFVLENENQ